MKAVEEVMKRECYCAVSEESQKRLDRIYADRLPLVQVEEVTAVAAVAVDATSIILTLRA